MDPWMWIVLLFCLGLVSILLETITPGGIVGSVGVVFLVMAIFFCFRISATIGFLGLAGSLVVGPVAFLLGMRLVRTTAVGRVLRLNKELDNKDGFVASDSSLEDLVGRTGVAASNLRPAGIAMIDDRRIDVVTEGTMIAKRTPIRVVEVEGNRVVVEELHEEET